MRAVGALIALINAASSAAYAPNLQGTPAVLRHRCQPRLSAPVAESIAWTELTEDAKRLTDASIARTVANVAGSGVLMTKLAGFEDAFPTHAPYVVEKSGSLLSPVPSKEAASNLAESKRVTFYARAPEGGAAAGSVLSLFGGVEELKADDVSDADLMDLSKATGESMEALAAKPWVRLTPERVHIFDSVRNVETWIALSEYVEAEANPLAPAAAMLLNKLNTQHEAPLKRFVSVYAGVPQEELSLAEIVSVDQMGFDIRMQLGPSAPISMLRAGFKMPPGNAEEGTSIFMKLFQEAYERENGFMK